MRRECLPFAALALCVAAAIAAPALAQDLEPDVVYARQILMSEIEAQMGPIDLAAVGEDFDLADSQARASAVSAMLGVTPYLFPEGTGADDTADRDIPSTALASVWDNAAGFKTMADQAAQLAFDLSQTTEEAAFREQAAGLRALCNSCHAAFMQPYDSPY